MDESKPTCILVGQDGNVFNIIGRVSASLKKAGLRDKSAEFVSKAMSAGSYDEVLQLAMKYVDVE